MWQVRHTVLVRSLCHLPSGALLNECLADHTRVIRCDWPFVRHFLFQTQSNASRAPLLCILSVLILLLVVRNFQNYFCFTDKFLCRFNFKFMSVIQIRVTRLLPFENPKGMNVLNSSDHNVIGNKGFLVEINRRSPATISDAGGVLKKIKTERSLLGAFAVFDAIFFFWTVWLAQ